MRIGSLFSGYGGADLAVASVFPGAHPAWFVEFDKHPSTVLATHWPDVPNYGDVTAVDWSAVEPVDILTGGYPCQPFSHAGKRKGTNDDRHLFPYVAAAVGVLRPRFVFLENVYGHLTLGGTDVIGTLTGLGYDARWGVVRASDAGAPHRRARLFIVAHAARERIDGTGTTGPGRGRQPANGGDTPTNTAGDGRRGGDDTGRAHVQRRGLRPSAAGRPLPTTDASSVRPERPAQGSATGRKAGMGSGPGEPGSSPSFGTCSRCECRGPVAGDGPVWCANCSSHFTDFGDYDAAIRRWERITERPAPAPTEPGRNGRPRLNPAFVEWMMGLPHGWVTDTGIPRNAQLKALGNGIVPQQMALALRLLLADEEIAGQS